MILKQDGIEHDRFVLLLDYLQTYDDGDKNVFRLEDIPENAPELEDLRKPEGKERVSLVLVYKDDVTALPNIFPFVLIKSATPKYTSGYIYWDVVLEIPDKVCVGISSGNGLIKNSELDFAVTTTRFYLKVHQILKET